MRSVRQAARQVVRSPGFALTVVLTLAIGIGASTLLYSVVDAVLLASLPYSDADRIVAVAQLNSRGARNIRVSDPNFADLKEQTHTLQAFAQYATYYAPVAGGDEPVRTAVTAVSADFFEVFGVRPALGRGFAPEEQALGGPRAALVSYSYWQRYLGGAPDFTGRTLRFGGEVYSIVGVMPRGFAFEDADVWHARELWPVSSRGAHNFYAVGRLAPRASLDEARRDFSQVARRLKAVYGDDTAMFDADVTTIRADLVAAVRLPLLVLSAAAALLYAIAVANVVNLLLARAVTRERELATRLALGARRATLAGGFFAEALVLCGLGAGLGLLGAWWGTSIVATFGDSSLLPRASSVHVGTASIAVALGLALLAAGGSSLLTAWRAASDAGALHGGRRTTASRSRTRLRDALVATQVGIALVLAVGASLLGRSYAAVTNVDPGFRPGGMVLMEAISPYARENYDEIRAFQDRVLEGLRALPGVESVGGVSGLPLQGGGTNGTFVKLVRPDEVRTGDEWLTLAKQPDRSGYAEYRVASAGYFQTLGIPLLRGRTFESTDTPEAAQVAVVSRSFAEAAWPGEDPLGKLLNYGNMDSNFEAPFTVVGVVGDVHDYGLDRAVRPTFYASYRQRPRFADSLWFAIRTSNTAATIAAAREVVRSVDADSPPTFQTSERLYAASIAQRRFNLVMLAVFGGAALLLALTGVYGAIAFSVAQRRHEIGVRIALGATVGRVIAGVLRGSLAIAAIGVGAGLAVALAGARVVSSLLYGVAPHDPASYVLASALLFAAAGAAALVPALRAARIDPNVTLRDD
ncbi:MAG TPA: ADOP family duplicated permease [Gammaproteobacteria bacterium]|nr:ADOP family duplicated permease [Gammaproteobacteria bacterium]